MSPSHTDDNRLARRRELATERRACLAAEPEKAMARILAYPQPAALVHSFPEEDFFFLLQDIGPDDAQPLIALGSRSQLEYVLDQQVWDRDRVDLQALSQWFGRFVAADPTRMTRWLTTEKANLVEFYLFNVLDIRIREHDQDPAEFGSGFISFDNVFYVHIRNVPAVEALGAVFQKNHQRLVRRLLEILADEDYVDYQRMLLAAINLLPAETEEEAYRLRNVRLAEKGFLPFEEAVGLYQPLRFDRFQQTAARFQRLPATGERRLPMAPWTLLDSEHLFSRALQTFSPGEALEQCQSEFASLCNCLAVADRRKVNSRDDLQAVVRKACGYLNIGLERLDAAASAPSPASAARQMRSFRLEGLFRLGYSQAADLKQEAEEWVTTSWFAQNGLPLTFWGETWLGVVGGLLLKRPLFYDNYRTGKLYREFASLKDIHRARQQLHQVQVFDRLLGRMGVERPPRRRFGHLTYKSVLLTLWARSALGLAEAVRPIALDAFIRFWESLFEAGQPDKTGGRMIRPACPQAFQQWLGRRAKQKAQDLEAAIGPAVTALFEELQAEYGRVSAEALDLRYINHFLLEKGKPRTAVD
jgi:hypothetical protein